MDYSYFAVACHYIDYVDFVDTLPKITTFVQVT